MPVSVDIVLPCFNPNSSWHSELISFYETAKKLYNLKFIVVNDGSVLGNLSQQISVLRQHQVPLVFIDNKINKGKGFALRHGVSRSDSDFIVCTDIDFPFTTQSTLKLIGALVQGNHDVVAGYREEDYYKNKMSGFRRILSKAFRFFIKSILNMPVSDTQCGLKGFNRIGKEVFLSTRINRYLFDFEFIYTACKSKKVRINPLSVQLKEDIVFSKMKLKILLQESLNLLYVLIFRKR